ncbi:MAG: hypothetical protein ACKVT1_14395 [Dehalococcoidia bacterium]
MSAVSVRGRAAETFDLPADPVAFSRECTRRGWSDGLPLIPPTAARVTEMLAAVRRDPLEVLGVLSPRQGVATVEAVAVNAVMAGCEPRQLPVLLAAVQAVADPAFNLDGINATTHPCGVFILASGPAARAAGIHGGSGCFGPGFPANVTIGRALRLVLLNVAGASPGVGDRATQATPAKLAFCATERDDASPWPPFQTTRGYAAGDSCVTAWACEGPHNIQEHGSNTAEGILQTIAGAMGQAGSNNILAGGEPLLCLGPEHAATIAGGGYSRESVQRYLFENARFPGARLSDEFRESVRGRMQGGEGERERDGMLGISDRPEEIHIMVAGGPGKHSCWMPTFGGMTRPVTVAL